MKSSDTLTLQYLLQVYLEFRQGHPVQTVPSRSQLYSFTLLSTPNSKTQLLFVDPHWKLIFCLFLGYLTCHNLFDYLSARAYSRELVILAILILFLLFVIDFCLSANSIVANWPVDQLHWPPQFLFCIFCITNVSFTCLLLLLSVSSPFTLPASHYQEGPPIFGLSGSGFL